ncbi:putative gamma-glutamylcysteine synthetase, partial [Operophtera brumata]
MVLSTASPDVVMNITRPHDDVQNKMAEAERKDLKIDYIDNVTLAYNPDTLHKDDTNLKNNHSTKASPISLRSNNLGRVHQLGVADVGGGCLRKLHAWSLVKPAIAQINLASCCVVPPALHAFCRANDVQLLTHADPPDLLSMAAVKTLSDAGVFCDTLEWCARYQVHIKCRGVLALKGYVCKATIGNRDDVK